MPAITIIIALLMLGKPAPQDTGNESQNPIASDPIEGIRAALDDHFIIAIGENHGHEQLYEWLELLLRNPGIQERVDDIVVEYGNLWRRSVKGLLPKERIRKPRLNKDVLSGRSFILQRNNYGSEIVRNWFKV